ncbi:MAG TPA: glycosyltransferase family 39 protein [Candidatus Saccharimonadales bacterium]|nr:glycosyltransferase family 39 protein [Candidatus Saccharimonadales bacterium]
MKQEGERTFVTLVLALAAATVLWLVLLHSGQNYQEQYNLHLAAQPVHLAAEGSPDDPMPLYYLLLHGYTAMLGNISLYAARSLSLIFLLLSVLAAFVVGRRMSGEPAVGRLAAILLAVSPFIIWYNSRATMYGLLLLVGLINQYFFDAILQRARSRDWVGYALTGLLGLGVHYFFAVILLLQLIFFLVKFHQYESERLWLLVGCQVLFAVAFLLWLHYSLAHSIFWHYLPFTGKPSATNAFILYVQFIFGFQSVLTTTLIIAFWPLLVVLGLLAIQKYVRPNVGVQYALWAGLTPMITMFIAAWIGIKPLFLTSYLSVAAAPFLLFIAWYLVAFQLKTLAIARAFLIAVMIGAFFVQLNNQPLALQQDYLGQATNQ